MPFHLEINKAMAESRAREICDWPQGNWRYGTVMDEFATVDCPPGERRALMTMGAGTCTIILIHKKLGAGALGHFTTAGLDGAEIGDAVRQMIAQLGDSADLKIVIAGCAISGADGEKYHREVKSALAARGDNVTFAWPGHHAAVTTYVSACFYLPHEEWACLTVDAPNNYKTMGSPFRKSGITSFDFKRPAPAPGAGVVRG